MREIILGLALVTLACSMHLLGVPHPNVHETALPAEHARLSLAEARKEFLSKVPEGPTADKAKVEEIK